MDKTPDFTGCDDCFCCWLKKVKIAFSLEEGPLESFSDYYKCLKVNVIAVTAAVGIEINFVDCHGGKQGGGGIFLVVVALVYIGV